MTILRHRFSHYFRSAIAHVALATPLITAVRCAGVLAIVITPQIGFAQTYPAVSTDALMLSVFSAGVAAGQEAVPAHISFVDDAESDPAFAGFRARLIARAERGDYPAVKRAISTRVQLDDETFGVVALERRWKIGESPRAFLKALVAVLRLGGRLDDDRRAFIAPYVWTEFPLPEESPSYVVVIRNGTKLLTEPSVSARTLGVLSNEVGRYEIVANPRWLKVTLVDGRVGFLRSTDVRRPNDYRAVFRLIGGRWQLTEFQAGVD